MRQVILDTETTGLSVKDDHRIIEVAAVELINRKLTGRHYHQYICPKRAIDPEALNIHGLSQEFLADKPEFYQISSALLAFVNGAELIIHNAVFDMTFLNHEFQKITVDFNLYSHCAVIDTLLLARKKHPGQANNLDALCKRYEIDNRSRQLHGALLDCNLLAGVYLAMTGGQTTLFAEASLTKQDSQFTVQKHLSNIDLSQLTIISADAEELSLHQALLEKMQAKNGGICVWPLPEHAVEYESII